MEITPGKYVAVSYKLWGLQPNEPEEELEETQPGKPLTFIYGTGSMLESFEKNLENLKPGLLPLNRRSLTRGDLVRLHGIIPAATYSRGTYRPTTIGAAAFHFRVRNGTGWDHRAVTTGLQSHLAFCKPTACPRSTSVLRCWRAAVGGLSLFLLSDCSLGEPFKKADICVA